MEDDGRKAETSESPIHSAKRRVVFLEITDVSGLFDTWLTAIEALKQLLMQVVYRALLDTHLTKEDVCSGLLDTHLTKEDVYSGLLDTHLTNQDVYSKVTRNNWRDGIFNLRCKHLPVHQVMVVFLLTITFTQGISTHCETNQMMNCTQLFLICSFDTDVFQLAKNLYMNHMQNNSMDLEIILVCQMSSKGFHCETTPRYEFISVESNRLTVKIPEINLKHVGKYWCNVQGFFDIDQVCQVSLPDTSSVVSDIFEQENGPSFKDDWLSPATIAIIVFSISLVLAGTSLLFIWFYIFKKRQIHYATHINLKNGRFASSTNTKEACELL